MSLNVEMMKRNIVFVILLIFLISCGKKEESTTPEIQTLTESVYASVTVQPEELYDVYASASGIISNIYFREGDTIAEGEILAKVTSDLSKLNKEQAQLNLKLAEAKYKGDDNVLDRLEKELEANQEQLTQDSINYERQKRLIEKGVGAKVDLETKKLKFDLSKKQLSILKKQYKQTEDELRNNYKQSTNAVEIALANLSDFSIRSKINGKIYSLLKEEGELITQQTPIAKIGYSNSFIIEMRIDEVDIASVSLNQNVVISLDAYKGKSFKAKITKIYPEKDERTQTFKVEAKFINPPDALYAGLSGEANIVVSQKDNVMTIPLEYLTEDGKVITEDGEIEVRTGMRNIERVEIESPKIDENTKIIKP
ncbi:MAG: efflux RND transporter periplasmic adaptor subunit [Ignavibacteriae bacterium]|nr:efflux RND transporter periplasmic adaptor subunit [Ignavibacteriota bacterium]